jgi:hypothetical protein
MKTWTVVTFASKAGAIGAHGTERRIYTVQAEDVPAARRAAIDAAYREGGLEHVKPVGIVTMITEVTND